MAVPAAGDQAEKRRFQILVGQIVGGDMPAQVMHRHQRLVCRIGQPLGKVDADEHRADQPRRKGHGHSVHIGNGHIGVGQRLVNGGADIFRMAAAGNLRHNAAVECLLLDAGGDDVGNDLSAILHDRRRRLVAGGLDP